MDEPVSGAPRFSLAFPVLYWVHKDDYQKFLGGHLEGSKRFVAVFTVEETAKSFIRERNLEESGELMVLLDAGELAEFLRYLKIAGFSHVVFDDEGKGGTTRLAFPIDVLVNVLGAHRNV